MHASWLSCRVCLLVVVAEIMELHHKKHHQAYVTNYNIALEKLADATVSQSLLLSYLKKLHQAVFGF